MICIFHIISLIIVEIISNKKRKKALADFKKIQQNINGINFCPALAYINAEQDLKFDPPVFKQRYGTIHDVLINEKWRKDLKKIVEFGCAEFGLFVFIKNLLGVTEIDFVDIDENLLKDSLYRIRPLTVEYLRRRSDPLTVNVFAGSITDPDRRICDADVVIGIEIIEHLYPDVLEAVPYTIFQVIQPKLVIFTTPNADFNVLLPNLKGFRHHDHKFEWTRKQFESWATNITDRFPEYFATFSGIGCGPEGTESFGCCSQMVVFVRRDVVDPSYSLPKIRCFCRGDMQSIDRQEDRNEKWNYCQRCYPTKSYGICTYFSYAEHLERLKNSEPAGDANPDKLLFYKLIDSVDFPYERDNRTQEEKIIDELKYLMNKLGHVNSRYFNYYKLRSEIPIVEMTYATEGQFITKEEVSTLLIRHGYKLEECAVREEEEDEKHLCLIYEPEMDDDTPSESEASGYESGHSRFSRAPSLSDWDDNSFTIKGEGQRAPEGSIFPDWLLNLLRTNFPSESNGAVEGPHFYCQGDGLGVHPSVITFNVNEEEEDASSESSLSSSPNETPTLPEEDNQNSAQTLISLPDDRNTSELTTEDDESAINTINSLLETIEMVHADDSEVFFDSVDDLLSTKK